MIMWFWLIAWILCGLLATFILAPWLMKIHNDNNDANPEKMDNVFVVFIFLTGMASFIIFFGFITCMKIGTKIKASKIGSISEWINNKWGLK